MIEYDAFKYLSNGWDDGNWSIVIWQVFVVCFVNWGHFSFFPEREREREREREKRKRLL